MEYIMRKRTVVVVILLAVVFAFWVVRLSLRKTRDTSVHSGNIEATIKPDLNYPYLGIWKTHPYVPICRLGIFFFQINFPPNYNK